MCCKKNRTGTGAHHGGSKLLPYGYTSQRPLSEAYDSTLYPWYTTPHGRCWGGSQPGVCQGGLLARLFNRVEEHQSRASPATHRHVGAGSLGGLAMYQRSEERSDELEGARKRKDGAGSGGSARSQGGEGYSRDRRNNWGEHREREERREAELPSYEDVMKSS